MFRLFTLSYAFREFQLGHNVRYFGVFQDVHMVTIMRTCVPRLMHLIAMKGRLQISVVRPVMHTTLA